MTPNPTIPPSINCRQIDQNIYYSRQGVLVNLYSQIHPLFLFQVSLYWAALPEQQLYLIILMRVNREEEGEECFIDDEFEEVSHTEPVELKVQITKKINEQMPANELRAALRPQNMAPRTFYLDRPLYLLKEALNYPQQESVSPVSAIRQKLRICNRENLSIEDYFSRKKFRQVYNKLTTFRNDSKSFVGKLKGVDVLIDYNWKSFKELEMEVDLLGDEQCDEDRIDSDFECGNLCRAYLNIQSPEKQYYMLIENDLNTYGYNNWFFFRVRNQQKGMRGFSMVNLIKKTNFFSQGMLISIFSVRKHQQCGEGWFKGGENVTFGPVNLTRQHHDNQNYYTLYFEYDFAYEQDEVYFSLSQPYTYTRLIDFLDNAEPISPRIKMEVKPLGYSIANNIIPVVRIYDQRAPRDNAILIISRQHPCETVGSFIAQKLMSFLLQDNAISTFLTSNYEIFVIPMVNPDGVIHGMSRTNMAGLDLNRHWGENILKELTPETMKVKAYIANLAKVKRIKYMIDLHGHGKKLNTFFFCCKGNDKDGNHLLTLCMKELEPRFNIYGCTFGISKDKENTLRSQMHMTGIKNSYTLETSLYGWKNSQSEVFHFNEKDYESIAQNLARSIFLLEADAESTVNHLGLAKEAIVKQLPLITEIKEREEKQTFESSQMMSDSDPEGDKLDVKQLLGKCQNKVIKKKLQQSYNALKRNFIKKYKKLSAVEANQSIKNLSLRESYAPPISSTFNPTANPAKTAYKPSEARVMRKSDTSQAPTHKPIKTIKFHEKPKESTTEKRKQLIDSLNLTRSKIKARVKTETNASQSKQIKVFSKNHLRIKNQEPAFTLKTQKISLKTEPDQKIQTKRTQLEIRFNELKKQSISMMLTDTISIFKVRRDRQKSSNRIQNVKDVSLDARKEIINSETYRQDQPSVLDADVIFSKARNLQQLVHTKGSQSSKFRSINSVYYHFPVL